MFMGMNSIVPMPSKFLRPTPFLPLKIAYLLPPTAATAPAVCAFLIMLIVNRRVRVEGSGFWHDVDVDCHKAYDHTVEGLAPGSVYLLSTTYFVKPHAALGEWSPWQSLKIVTCNSPVIHRIYTLSSDHIRLRWMRLNNFPEREGDHWKHADSLVSAYVFDKLELLKAEDRTLRYQIKLTERRGSHQVLIPTFTFRACVPFVPSVSTEMISCWNNRKRAHTVGHQGWWLSGQGKMLSIWTFQLIQPPFPTLDCSASVGITEPHGAHQVSHGYSVYIFSPPAPPSACSSCLGRLGRCPR